MGCPRAWWSGARGFGSCEGDGEWEREGARVAVAVVVAVVRVSLLWWEMGSGWVSWVVTELGGVVASPCFSRSGAASGMVALRVFPGGMEWRTDD